MIARATTREKLRPVLVFLDPQNKWPASRWPEVEGRGAAARPLRLERHYLKTDFKTFRASAG